MDYEYGIQSILESGIETEHIVSNLNTCYQSIVDTCSHAECPPIPPVTPGNKSEEGRVSLE